MRVAWWFFDCHHRHPIRRPSALLRMIVGGLQVQECDLGSWDATWEYSLIQGCMIEMEFGDEKECMLSRTVLELK